MNILKKVGLTALGTSLIATSAFAGAMDVTGSAGITLANQDKTNKGNGLSMTDEITFTGSGELDNGLTVTVSMQLDDNAVSTATGTHYMDNRSVKIESDFGTLTFYGHGGDTAFSMKDDTTPTAYGEAWDVLGTSSGGTAKLGSIAGAATGNDMFGYTNSGLMDGLTLNVSYMPSEGGAAQTESTTAWGVEYSGVEGLTVGYAQDDNGLSGTSEIEYDTAYVKYAFGSFTVGFQEGEQDQKGATTSDDEYSAFGISYQVNDDLSVSYNTSERDFGDGDNDQESEAMQLSYTTGGVTIAAALAEVKNVGGSANAQDDIEGFEIDVSFAF